MRRILRVIFSEWGFVFVVLAFATVISLWPTFYELSIKDKLSSDRSFELVSGFIWDFHVYLSRMLQGASGQWLVMEKYTSEPHSGSLLQIFYLFLGKVGGGLGFSTVFTYHVARVIFGILWFLAGYFFIKLCFPTRPILRKLSFLFFVFSGNFPKLIADQNGYGFSLFGKKYELYLSGWTHLIPSDRIPFVPHWNAGHLFTVLTLIFLWKWVGEKRWKWGIVSGLCAIIAGFILPPALVISLVIFSIFSLYLFFESLVKKSSLKSFLTSYVTVLPFWILAAISLVYNLWVTSFYPWKALVEGDIYITRTAFPYMGYLWALGVTSFLGLLGMILVFLLRRKSLYFAALWVLGTFFLIFVFDKFLVWHNQTQFVKVGVDLPLSVLTVFFLDFIFFFFKKWRSSLLVCATVILLLPSVLTWAIGVRGHIDFINQKMGATYPAVAMGPFEVYPVKAVMEAVSWLGSQEGEGVTFSGPSFGNYLGAYTNRFSYIGHGAQTVRYYQEKLPTVERFYKGELSKEEIKPVFLTHRVGYVIFGPEEKTWREKPPDYPFLKKVFESGEVGIYKVIMN